MRKIKEVLRLYHEKGLSQNAVAGACGIARATVQDYLKRCQTAGLGWPLPEELDEADLNALLFRRAAEQVERPQPDWAALHQELARKGMTLQLLWQEYRQTHPQGYHYTRFCQLYRQWAKSHKLSMRQRHRAGEKLLVDWAGQTMPITDAASGEVSQAQIFVAALGASNYLYVEARPSQNLENWLAAHVNALQFYGGVPEIVVPDNPKVAVTSPCRYEPDLNPAYQDLALHYGVAVIPTRVRKPRDKALVEVGVQIVERWLLAPLRHRTFFSVAELNQALGELLREVNEKLRSGLQKSRRELFETLDQPALKPLPPIPYEFAQWKQARVNLDYHVELEKHAYSVPYRLVHQVVELRYTSRVVEVYQGGRRLACHVRQPHPGQTTRPEHMPEAHRQMLEWTPSRFLEWASSVGCHTHQMIQQVLDSPRHPEQNYRSCLGFLQLERKYGGARLEQACARARFFGLQTYKQVGSLLKTRQDLLPLPVPAEQTPPTPGHSNIRGPQCYH